MGRRAAAAKVGDAGRAPLQVVGQKHHLHFAPVDFHQRGDAPHDFRIASQGARRAQADDLIAQDATGRRQRLEDFAGQVLLGAR